MILVTGAAGKTGRAVIAALAERQLPVRALVHRREQLAAVEASGAVEVAIGDQRDVSVLRTALEAAAAVYHIAPNVHPDEIAMGTRMIDACRGAGTGRVVYHSVIHPQLESMPHHWRKLRVEEQLIESGLDWTILRPAAYLQNVLGYLDDARRTGRYEVPYDIHRPAWMVDLADVASVAAMVLDEDRHVYASYDLCGPDAVTATGVATAVSAHLGRPVEAVRIDPDDWQRGAESRSLPPASRQALHAMFRHYDDHGVPGNPRVLSLLLRRRPGSLSDVLERQASPSDAGST